MTRLQGGGSTKQSLKAMQCVQREIEYYEPSNASTISYCYYRLSLQMRTFFGNTTKRHVYNTLKIEGRSGTYP
jgi:hypothetical protein